MKKNISTKLGAFATVGAAVLISVPAVAAYDKSYLNKTEVKANGSASNSESLMDKVGTMLNVVFGVMGLLAVAVIILGGFQYMTSTGDVSKVQKAKNTILYGIVGLVIALLAYAIVRFVLDKVLGV